MTEPSGASLDALEQKATSSLEQAENATQLEQWRIIYLGRRGTIPSLLREIKNLDLKKRREVGKRGNALRQKLEKLYQQKKEILRSSDIPGSTFSADTLPPATIIGHLHPLTLASRRIQQIFSSLGFLIVEGPEIEESKFNFDQLNIPLEHPARAETDTFHIKESHHVKDLVLRTHTSPVQLRAVLELGLTPPFKILSPGRAFRAERTDTTHETTFYQFEGLVVGNDITIADFKATIETFYEAFFGKQVSTRLRPGYFPFVEPGFEVDITCQLCQQKGCRACQNTGWIEIMGAGMVHPNVLKNMNVNSKLHQGFAFGQSIDRIAMLQHGIPDIRLFWSGDIRFLKQFS